MAKAKATDICELCGMDRAWHKEHHPRHVPVYSKDAIPKHLRRPKKTEAEIRFELGLTEILLEVRHGRTEIKVHRESDGRHLVVYTYNDGDPQTAVTDTIFVDPTGSLENCIREILMRQLDKPATYSKVEILDWIDDLTSGFR